MEKKKSVKNVILTILLLLLAAALVIIPFALEKLQETVEDKGSVHSAAASLASVSRTVSGAGTLIDENAVDVKLPYGVEVTKYLVNNNDFVTEGQALAEVDRVSVMNSINEYQEDLQYVESQMALYTDSGAVNFLTTASAGRVMELYAREGDSINDVMLEHGALAVLSLDGLLAVDIENDKIPVGSSVGVAASDGSIASGHVESKKGGMTVITVSQDNRAVGETVNIISMNNETLGSGELYVHSPLRISGYSGEIEAVHVKIGQDMFRGGTLFTYSGNSSSAEYEVYAAKHTELADYMEDLFKMYTDGTVNAKCTGVISGIDEDAAAELLAASGEKKAELDFLVNRGSRPDVQTVNNEGSPYYRIGKVGQIVRNEDGITGQAFYELSKSQYYSLDQVVYALQTGVDGWDIVVTPLFIPSYGISMTNVMTPNTYLLVSYAGTAPGTSDVQEPGYIAVIDAAGKVVPSGGGGGGAGRMFGAMSGGMSGSVTVEKAYEYYPTKQSRIMSVTPQDTMTIDITVDELDILSIRRGQAVQITLDALTGQSFDGVITDIGVSGSNSGGNTKYTAEVTIDRASNMIAGMNATALITLFTSEGLVTIPTEALVCEGTKTYVYTSYDSKNDELGSPTDVKTGASDGLVTEIISGLKEGDTVWYNYFDKPDTDFDFGSMQMPPDFS